MGLTVRSAIYLHKDSHIHTRYLIPSMVRMSEWCRHVGVELKIETFSMSEWIRNSAKYVWPAAFEIGCLVKFASMQSFLRDEGAGDRYIWFDMDIWPTDKAFGWSPESLPQTGFWGFEQQRPVSWSGFPGPLRNNRVHVYTKEIWANCRMDRPYFHVLAGVFSMTRKNVEAFLKFVENGNPIGSAEWWKAYRDKQMSCKKKADTMRCGGIELWHFGADEHFLEDWLNNERIEFSPISHDIHSCLSLNPNALLVHYDGWAKSQFPCVEMPNAPERWWCASNS